MLRFLCMHALEDGAAAGIIPGQALEVAFEMLADLPFRLRNEAETPAIAEDAGLPIFAQNVACTASGWMRTRNRFNDHFHEALAEFERFADQRVSYTDAISFVLMKKEKIREATGKDASAIELTAEELEDRVSPRTMRKF